MGRKIHFRLEGKRENKFYGTFPVCFAPPSDSDSTKKLMKKLESL